MVCFNLDALGDLATTRIHILHMNFVGGWVMYLQEVITRAHVLQTNQQTNKPLQQSTESALYAVKLTQGTAWLNCS